jgi:chorismate synthase
LAVIEGVPAGLPLAAEAIDRELRRRQGGYGRGGRMRIEQDRVEILGGVRFGETTGAPVALLVRNRDWDNWRAAMDPMAAPVEEAARRAVYRPRPGHADLVGALKYDRIDARDVLERASARETAARVAAGAVAKALLARLGIAVGSHVTRLGGVAARPPAAWPADLAAAADRSPVRCLDPEAEARMIEAIDRAKAAGDTLGGVFEVVATGVPVGLGSYVSWDRRLDARLGAALLSIPAIKGVEIGLGFAAAELPGSQVHDPIVPAPDYVLGGRLRPRGQPGRRVGRRNQYGAALGGACRHETDLHPDDAAADGGPTHGGGRGRGEGTLGCLRRARGRDRRGGDGGLGAGRGGAGEVRGRLRRGAGTALGELSIVLGGV